MFTICHCTSPPKSELKRKFHSLHLLKSTATENYNTLCIPINPINKEKHSHELQVYTKD